jgi:hypothetical protein
MPRLVAEVRGAARFCRGGVRLGGVFGNVADGRLAWYVHFMSSLRPMGTITGSLLLAGTLWMVLMYVLFRV